MTKDIREDSKLELIISSLREQIKRGDFGTKGRIPPIAQLMKDYGVARTTINQVFQLLQSEGLVTSKANAYYVSYFPIRIQGSPSFDRFLSRQGVTSVVDSLIEPEIITMPKEVADLFGQQEGLHVVHRLRRHGTPMVHLRLSENWYPADLAGQFLEAIRQDPNLNVAGEIRKAHGIRLARASEDVINRLPTHEEMELLNIVRTAPVTEARRVFFSDTDKVMLYSRTVLVAAYFVFHYEYSIPSVEEIK